MCGLVGYSGTEPFEEEKVKLLMIWNSLERGMDSVGIYTPEKGLFKSLESGRTLFFSDTEKYKVEASNLFIGHVRAATIGGKTLNNAHPFKRGNYILAHNGTLTNHKELIEKYNLGLLNIEVDSDVICASICGENNFDVLSHIGGAVALLITNTENPDTLYAYTNGERPLYRGYSGNNMYISSIKESLELLGLVNIKLFKENVLYTIKNGSITKTRKINVNVYRTSKSILQEKVDYERFNNVRLKTTGNEYYTIVNITEANTSGKKEYMYMVRSMDGIRTFTTNESNVVLHDIIYKEDFVYTIDDIKKSVYDSETKAYKEKTIPKGTLCKATIVYNDGDVTIVDTKTGVNYGHIKRFLVVKTTKKEFKNIEKSGQLMLPINNTSDNEEIDLDSVEINISYGELRYFLEMLKNKVSDLEDLIVETERWTGYGLNLTNDTLDIKTLIDEQDDLFRVIAEEYEELNNT